jgi:hypothetical protein
MEFQTWSQFWSRESLNGSAEAQEAGGVMDRYEYKITRHLAGEFTEIIYFCSTDGSCNVERIPADQIMKIQEILNKQGMESWELVQVSFGKDGILVFWKRKIAGEDVGGK